MAILPLLYRVQEIETRLGALDQALTRLNQNANLEALRLLQSELGQSIEKHSGELLQLKSRQRQLDLDVKTNQERLESEEQKLYSGAISNARELGQVQQKADEYRSMVSKSEDELLGLMEQDETLAAELERLNRRQTLAAEEVARFQNEIKHQSLELQIEKDQLQMEFEDLLLQIPGDWLEKYRRIAKSHRGIGIAKLKQSNCGACHVSLSDFKLQQVRRGEDKLTFCENCGRILYC